jgi:hypothetical protein
MADRSDTPRRAGWILLGLAFGLGCGGGGKSEPADLSSVVPAEDSAIEDSALDPMAEAVAADSSSPPVSETTAYEYPELSPPPEQTDSVPTAEAGGDSSASPTDDSAAEDGDESPIDFSVTVIEPGTADEDSEGPSLVEAAAAERARRRTAPPTDIVITNKNLSEYAVGELTVAVGSDDTTVSDANAAALEERRAEEEYWRSRALEIRTAWADAAERVEELEAEVFHLRQRFYAEDDGFYRDSQIKPAWDRAIEQLQDTNLEIEERQEELAAFLEEGREAGALPGWLREGVDLEPEVRTDEEGIYIEPDRNEYQPGEPVVVEEHDQGSGR